MFQSPRRPVAVHRAVLEGDPHALVGGALREPPPDLPEARQAVGQRLAADAAGEAGDGVGAEEMRVVDQRLPAGQRLAVERLVLERIAEHAERADDDVGVADRLADLAGEPRDVLVAERLPEERLDALEAERQDLPDVGGRVGEVALAPWCRCGCREAGSATVGSLRRSIATCRPVSALSIAPKTMARLLMLSVPRVSGSRAARDRGDEVLHHAEMAADAVARVERRHLDRRDLVEEPVAAAGHAPRRGCRRSRPRSASPRSPTIRHALSQLVRSPSAHQLPRR